LLGELTRTPCCIASLERLIAKNSYKNFLVNFDDNPSLRSMKKCPIVENVLIIWRGINKPTFACSEKRNLGCPSWRRRGGDIRNGPVTFTKKPP